MTKEPDLVALLATWRAYAEDLRVAKVAYAKAYLQAKIRKESDGTAHQIATEETGSQITKIEADIDICKAIFYGGRQG